ncbi:GPI inositol-deacylase [Pleurostoma richardsiae]|uniref:GPI inositol-deacylase n=1 Tax=Pleurostoma richardsiae TaxID=41990 RepID=A0AA38VIN5_9PEZI|nr:GPI inositol-deacylase [Pleurostoma richardsiae]
MTASAVEPASSFPRSHSTPDLVSSLTKPAPSISTNSANYADLSCTLNLNTKSLPSLPAFDVPSFDFDLDFDRYLQLETKSARPAHTPDEKPRPAARPASKPMAEPKAEELSRSRSFIERRRSWLPSSKSTTDVRDALSGASKSPRKNNGANPERSGELEPNSLAPRDRSASFVDFAKKSWISSSRSPSPKRDKASAGNDTKTTDSRGRPGSNGSSKSPSRFSRKRLVSSLVDGEGNRSSDSLSSTSRALNRAGTFMNKIKQRPQSVLISAGATTPALAVSAPSPPANVNADSALSASGSALDPASANSDASLNPRRLSSQTGASSTTDCSSVTNGTTSTCSEQSRTTADTMPHPSSRDPLWAAFRKLDADFATFSSKSTTAQRMIVIRQALVPFLRTNIHHPSNKDTKLLSPEDIDRRATIFNKWWNGLLELLDGTGNKPAATLGMSFASSSATLMAPASTANLQPVAGVDRPALLEAITHIMMRPEWRLLTKCFRPLAERCPRELVRARADSNNSMGSSSEALLAESAEHNVRTMFVGNLLTQMTMVVDKLSSRHAPLSLVNFCGKACAYAFFFVPGAAEVLVRLWGLTSDVLRRVADQFGLPRRSRGESEDIVALFPPNLHKLGWSSVKTMTDNLRLATKLPLVMAKIPWHGPWVSRWRGADTDLFFIFCKYYYILSDEFMPPGLPLVEKARAPAFVLLHAQLLGILDTTIHHRQAAFDAMAMGPPIGDPLLGADAMVTTLPQLPPSNLLRGMDENRMIILLKDILAENSIRGVAKGARETFGDAFMAILRAATKKTPTFRHGPVFMLLDFVQEALAAFDGYAGYTDPEVRGREPAPVDHVDWPFWLDVYQLILDSNNTMSEIRMLSFIFTTWDIITSDPARKEKVCFSWLLREDVFDKFFNHYSPMVRAYFMRLLCWRICRDEGSANELNAKVFALVSERLKKVWSHYLWLKQQADAQGKLPPSTAPAHPQPGKRFMIIRTEIGTAQTGLLMGFDSFSSPFPPNRESDQRGAASGSGSADPGDGGKDTAYKKKWSIIGKVLSFTGSTVPVANYAGRRTADDELEAARRATAASRSGAPAPPPKGSGSPSSESDASSTGSSPVYDAAQFVFKFTLSSVPWQPAQGFGAPGLVSAQPRDRILTRPRLPYPAQAKVSARAAAAGRRSESPPPPAPGLPPPERRVSGLPQKGLVSEARNASPLEDGRDAESPSSSEGRESPRIRTTVTEVSALDSPVSPVRSGPLFDVVEIDLNRAREPERQIIQAIQPVGAFRDRATYSGRALAEWSLVVNECNSFVDRRRDEGVFGLKEVEVPLLGIDGLRRMA